MHIFPEKKVISCSYIIADEEWRCIEVFRRRAVDFLEERKRISPGKFTIHFSRESDGNLSGDAQLPDERDLRHFYWAFRFFYHNDEPSNFNKVANIISKNISDALVCEAIKRIKAQWKGSFAKTLSDFHGKKYSSEKIIDAWFNAHYFHSDKEKEQKLNELNGLLKGELSRISLFMAVWDSGLAIANLHAAVENMEREKGQIVLPYFMNREQ